MPFSWFLAIRYLKPKRSFLSIITIISVLGVALGVAVLLVVISVMNGFDSRIRKEILKFSEPVKVIAPRYSLVTDLGGDSNGPAQPDWQILMAELRRHPEVLSVSPVIRTTALLDRKMSAEEQDLQSETGSRPSVAEAVIIGVDTGDTAQMERLQEHLQTGVGKVELEGASILLTEDLQDKISVSVREEVEQTLDTEFGAQDHSAVLAYGPNFLAEWQQRHRDDQRLEEIETAVRKEGAMPLREWQALWEKQESEKRKAATEKEEEYEPAPVPAPPGDPPSETIRELRQKEQQLVMKDRKQPAAEELQLTGVIPVSRLKQVGFVSLHTAQSMSGAGRKIDHLALTLKDPYRAGEVKSMLKPGLPEGWHAVTWMEEHEQFFQTIAMERSIMYFILSCIVVVAAFCIMNTTIVMAVQKRREIGLMTALGARRSQIIALFTNNGAVIGMAGVVLGFFLGITLLHYRNEFREWLSQALGIQVFPAEIYHLPSLPSEARAGDYFLICGGAFLLCAVAALIPAWVVARLDPARALRTDR